MTDARWDEFYQAVEAEGLYPKRMDVRKAYTLTFVNHKVGLEMQD